jgi:predicted secreted protein with PEFG-CTERM motif
MYAVAHGYDGEILDVGISIETLDLKPNEIKEFNMYIDPIFAGKVAYFSCFAPSDPLVVNLTTTRYNEPFEIYAEGFWMYNPIFDEDNNILYVNATNNSLLSDIKIPMRIQVSSLEEKFKVYLDYKPVDVFQSIEEDGMSWHVIFNYPARTYIHDIRITGFAEPEYRYIKLDTNNTRIIAQLPINIIPMEDSSIKLAFYNLTSYRLLQDLNYNIQFSSDNETILDLDRTAINGIDIIKHRFEEEGVIEMHINILGEEKSTSLVVVPEFPIAILIITVSMTIAIILRYKSLMH